MTWAPRECRDRPVLVVRPAPPGYKVPQARRETPALRDRLEWPGPKVKPECRVRRAPRVTQELKVRPDLPGREGSPARRDPKVKPVFKARPARLDRKARPARKVRRGINPVDHLSG